MHPTPARPWLLDLNPPAPDVPGQLPADTTGLAFSGGGIRSAAYCLGVLQALARCGWLPRIDFLSSVSGGGYTGGFLGRFFDLCGKPDGPGGAIPNATPGFAQDRVARDLSDSRSAPLDWLRRHANYLSPTGKGELANGLAAYWRNLVSIYLVVGVLLFAAFGLLNAVAYVGGGVGVRGLIAFYTPFTPLSATFIDHPTPWAVLCELVLWLAVVPLALAYWVVAQDRADTFRPPVLVAAATIAAIVLVAVGSPVGVMVVLATVIWAGRSWQKVQRSEGHFDPRNSARTALPRTHLTAWLAGAFAVAAGLGAFAAIDAAGKGLASLMTSNGRTPLNVGAWLVSISTMILGLASGIGTVAGLTSGLSRWRGAWAFTRPYLTAAIVLLLGGVPPLIAVSFAAHAAYGVGLTVIEGMVATILAIFVCLILGLNSIVPFINRSGPMPIYASRLARAFFGAVNPARRLHPEGRNVAYLVPGDDLPHAEYAPHAAGGPLHLINCAVNETVDAASQRGVRDRQAENFAVGPAGVSVAQKWHALWEQTAEGRRLRPLAERGEAAPHPLLAKDADTVAAEELTLREWVAVSGGALSPGMGRQTGLAHALLFTLANLRLGYWWNSGLDAAERDHLPRRRTITDRFRAAFRHLFRAQTLLLSELVGRFAGPWERFWAVSDGGNFEVTGAYELLRRRVQFVIVCDAGEDPRHVGADFARLVRLARVDLGAEVADADLGAVPPDVLPHLAPLEKLLAARPPAHAALLKVTYPPPPPTGPDPWGGRGHTWMLYIKASLTGDEPADVAHYAAEHPDFPNESTLNQFFDEPQWESYRELGDHTGRTLFG